MDAMDETRARSLNEGTPQSGPVLYWMSRDQRAADNWALYFAQEYALRQRVPLAVVFCLLPVFGEATIRQYSFMLRGLAQTATRLLEVGIPSFCWKVPPQRRYRSLLRNKGLAC
jgi:deoxyribodipyrimidine photo-lyase